MNYRPVTYASYLFYTTLFTITGREKQKNKKIKQTVYDAANTSHMYEYEVLASVVKWIFRLCLHEKML